MSHDFDADYWQAHWRETGDGARFLPPNPAIAVELAGIEPGTALDAGCGEGTEAIELARRGWQVTGADLSAEALERGRARTAGMEPAVSWLEADLARWEPEAPFDLVTTFYAHPDIPQLDFYDRIARWVAPGGTLLIVGHLQQVGRGGGHAGGHPGEHGHHAPAHQHEFPVEATVRAADVVALLDDDRWNVVTADERQREVPDRDGHPRVLHDVVVRASRR